jgi:hypothetical protein
MQPSLGKSATTYGWFSKIIYDLRLDQQQCIGSWFLGSWGFNDEISSHRWRDDLGNLSSVGMIGRPYRLSVYQNTNAQGTRKRWTASGYSSDYLYPTVSIDIVNYGSWNYDGTSRCIDNDVTSILFEYRVFTPKINED